LSTCYSYSMMQVLNHFTESVNVYYMTRRGNEVECVGTVESGDHINLPLSAVYTPTNELFFSVQGYVLYNFIKHYLLQNMPVLL